MSWNFHLQKINQSFESIASWYKEFMHRTELCFRAMHERIVCLEERQSLHAPSDEQVERVLRKILAEKFSDTSIQPLGRFNQVKEETYFVEGHSPMPFPRPVAIDPGLLCVEVDAVPSQQYAETFRMLESKLAEYPHLSDKRSTQQDSKDVKMRFDVKDSKSLHGV
ncbi:hypothetical protein EK21DRAFT_110174 [Setomelanomma holmii]|uniref:Uncharacterized protein n=1 Tax=Setomelanomma holmii TaxID=210430 RepID=A0A9P4HCP3_9PLEO|nr:hypothetical protein EK21DRAFT_110174 [Setomelanomma holmii]